MQYLHTSFNQLNGTDITDGSLTIQLLHELEGADRFDPYFQGDVISNQLSYDLSIDTALVQGTFGLTDRLDLGLIVPVVSVDMTISNSQTIQQLATQYGDPTLHVFPSGGLTNSVAYSRRGRGSPSLSMSAFRPVMSRISSEPESPRPRCMGLGHGRWGSSRRTPTLATH